MCIMYYVQCAYTLLNMCNIMCSYACMHIICAMCIYTLLNMCVFSSVLICVQDSIWIYMNTFILTALNLYSRRLHESPHSKCPSGLYGYSRSDMIWMMMVPLHTQTFIYLNHRYFNITVHTYSTLCMCSNVLDFSILAS